MGIVRVVCSIIVALALTGVVLAQPGLTGPITHMVPSSPLSMPASYGGSSGQSISVNSSALSQFMPSIPNLELGFQYFFGNRVRSGQASVDYLLPVNLDSNSVVFGEAHGNWWNFLNKPTGGASSRVDLSFGGGYRSMLADQLLFGINGFYDTSRLFDQWYSSGSVGFEMAVNVGTNDAVDLNANWYGNIFSSTDILNAFRNKGGSYDIEAGYSHALFDNSLDLRLKLAGYQFDTGSSVYGFKTGADLTTKDGMFMLRYEYGSDRINGQWNNIGAFVNIGFQMENIIRGESPFTAPEPIFKSPRNLRRMLAQKVKRDWNQQYAPGKAALAAAAVNGGGGVVMFIPVPDSGHVVFAWKPFALSGVDYTRLVPDEYVVVTLDYKNNTAATLAVLVADGSGNTAGANTSEINGHASGSLNLVLNSRFQSTFTSNPISVQISTAGNAVDVENIKVFFTYR